MGQNYKKNISLPMDLKDIFGIHFVIMKSC